MSNSDWRQVYREERRRPGYVVENGKSVEKIRAKIRLAMRPQALASVQGKAA